MKNKTKLAEKWFYRALISTIFFPILAAIIQFFSLGYEFSNTDENNWVTITDTFSLQFEMVKVLGGLTAMIGLLYRSLQTKEQIALSEKKENFALYISHKEHILKRFTEMLGFIESTSYQIVEDVFYKSFYPENTAQDIVNFEFNEMSETSQKQFLILIELLSSVVCDFSETTISSNNKNKGLIIDIEKMNDINIKSVYEIQEIFRSFGIHYQEVPTTDDDSISIIKYCSNFYIFSAKVLRCILVLANKTDKKYSRLSDMLELKGISMTKNRES